MDKAKEDYERIIAKFDSEVSRALESPHDDFDENGDDDSEDIEKNFKPAQPEPEHSATVDMQGPVARDSYKQDEIVDKNPMYSYDGKKREGVYDANKDRKGSNETVYRSRSGLINGTETYETVDVDFSETDSAVEFTCNCGVRVTEANLPKHMEEAHGRKLTEARYKTYKNQNNIGINESDANVNDIGLGKKTRAGESLAKEGAYDNLSDDVKFIVANHYDGLSREDKEDWAKMSGGSATPDTKFVDLSKEIQDIWVESWDYDKDEVQVESLAKEDIHFGISDYTSGGSPSEQQDAFNSAFGVSTPEEEEQIEDSIDDKMNPIESAYFDIKSEYWESFIDDPVKLDEFLQRVESLRADAEQAVATIPRRRSGFYTRRNFDEVEWLNTVINDMQGIIRQAEPMKNNGLFESFPRGNVGESLAREDQIHTQDGWWRNVQDVDFNFESLQKAIADIESAMNGASTSEMIQLQQEYDYYNELLAKFTEDKSNLDKYGIVNQDTPEYSTAPWGIYESNAKAVWKSYEMEDEYETQMHGQGWNTETDEEEDDQSKVSLNINSGTLTDKQIETEEHHTKSDKDSTSPDDEGFSTSNIVSGNYEKVIGYNPDPNHNLGDHKLKSKKGERRSQDNPASETQTFYSNIIGKLSGLESDE